MLLNAIFSKRIDIFNGPVSALLEEVARIRHLILTGCHQHQPLAKLLKPLNRGTEAARNLHLLSQLSKNFAKVRNISHAQLQAWIQKVEGQNKWDAYLPGVRFYCPRVFGRRAFLSPVFLRIRACSDL